MRLVTLFCFSDLFFPKMAFDQGKVGPRGDRSVDLGPQRRCRGRVQKEMGLPNGRYSRLANHYLSTRLVVRRVGLTYHFLHIVAA
jgi:hypothetical protein